MPVRLWAPWRMEFIRGAYEKPKGCLFCNILKDDENDGKNLVLYRRSMSFIMLNRFPYAHAHLMIVPHTHSGELDELPEEESHQLMDSTKLALTVLKKVYSPDGFNIGINMGKVAGAGFADHIHIHIVPRWNGDHNFMPVLADARVMPEVLEQTYQDLASGFKEMT